MKSVLLSFAVAACLAAGAAATPDMVALCLRGDAAAGASGDLVKAPGKKRFTVNTPRRRAGRHSTVLYELVRHFR